MTVKVQKNFTLQPFKIIHAERESTYFLTARFALH